MVEFMKEILIMINRMESAFNIFQMEKCTSVNLLMGSIIILANLFMRMVLLMKENGYKIKDMEMVYGKIKIKYIQEIGIKDK